MAKLATIIIAALLLTSCSDGHDSSPAPLIVPEPLAAKPLAVLLVEQQEQFNDLTAVTLDATDSRADSASTATTYAYEIRQNEAGLKMLLAGPGQSESNFVTALLVPGDYSVTLTVANSAGENASVTQEVTVKGNELNNWRASQVRWSLDSDYEVGDSTETFYRRPGAISLGLISSLYQGSVLPDNQAVASKQSHSMDKESVLPDSKLLATSQALGASSGCGSGLNSVGNGLSVFSGAIGLGTTVFFPEAEAVTKTTKVVTDTAGVASTGTKISGGNKSGACVQAQINGINDQLQFQEEQITGLYDLIGRDQDAFFQALLATDKEVWSIENETFDSTRGHIKLAAFMQAAALWEVNTPWMGPNGETLELDLLKIAASNFDSRECTVGLLTNAECTSQNLPSGDGYGPIADIKALGGNYSMQDIIELVGLKVLPNCTYDCWKGVAASEGGTTLINLYKGYAGALLDAVNICTSTDINLRRQCPVEDDNNVVPLFDQYNAAITTRFLQAGHSLQQAHYMDQLTNLYNYHRYVASQCANGEALPDTISPSCLDLQSAGQPITVTSIRENQMPSGTFYDSAAKICGTYDRPTTAEQNAESFNCAQQQLALLYAQRFNVLYTHMLNYTITDSPVGAQAYPSKGVVFPDALRNSVELNAAFKAFNEYNGESGLGETFDYDYEIGRLLPAVLEGARTPIDFVERLAGTQGTIAGENWTADGVLYQAYQLGDTAACFQTLLNYNASGQPDTDLQSIYPKYEDCPRLFSLHDGTAISEGFYNGITLQPYSYEVSPGGSSKCSDSCNCLAGVDINNPASNSSQTQGGQGLFSNGANDGQCRGFCNSSGVCGNYLYADANSTDCTQCSEAKFQSVLALSAPMGGNIRQCKVVKAEDVNTYVAEGATINTCPSIYYGKQYANSLSGGTVPVMPGSGALASFQQVLIDGAYTVFPALPALDWSSDTSSNNGSWSGSCTNPIFSGYAGNPDAPPTLQATCEGAGSAAFKKNSKVSCETARWGNNNGQLYCEPVEPKPTFYTFDEDTTPPKLRIFNQASLVCDNEALGGDPAEGFLKQCFCPGGNQLGWFKPDSTIDSVALTYLSCGNFAKFNEPRVAWEYYGKDGSQKDPANGDFSPPTVFRTTATTNSDTTEIDIGQAGLGTGSGVKYTVAYANLDTSCNLDRATFMVRVIDNTSTGFSSFSCESPTAYQTPLTEATDKQDRNLWAQLWTEDEYGFQPNTCLAFGPNVEIQNRDNAVSMLYNLILTPPNIRSVGSGPGIPIDLVLQCSDDINSDNAPDCNDQSMCMHMVSHNDGDTVAESEKMAKRGYICTEIHSSAVEGSYAQMNCELADGREFSLTLQRNTDSSNKDSNGDHPADIYIDWVP